MVLGRLVHSGNKLSRIPRRCVTAKGMIPFTSVSLYCKISPWNSLYANMANIHVYMLNYGMGMLFDIARLIDHVTQGIEKKLLFCFLLYSYNYSLPPRFSPNMFLKTSKRASIFMIENCRFQLPRCFQIILKRASIERFEKCRFQIRSCFHNL